jgi:hypothetical protein
LAKVTCKRCCSFDYIISACTPSYAGIRSLASLPESLAMDDIQFLEQEFVSLRMCHHLLYPDQLLIQCSNFRCCGSTLTSLHELLDHFETTHVLLSNQHGWSIYTVKGTHCQMALQFLYLPPGLALSPTTHRTEHEWHAHVYALDAPVDPPAPPPSLSASPSSSSYL